MHIYIKFSVGWHIWCKDEWNPGCITRLCCETKTTSMEKDDAGNIWLGSLISYCSTIRNVSQWKTTVTAPATVSPVPQKDYHRRDYNFLVITKKHP